jgi:hypothetical protein
MYDAKYITINSLSLHKGQLKKEVVGLTTEAWTVIFNDWLGNRMQQNLKSDILNLVIPDPWTLTNSSEPSPSECDSK